MIVLDEQLLGRNLEILIVAWYPGAGVYITDLRPNTVIKDDAIPALLGQQAHPTFITINASDFWQKVTITDRFCIICFTLPDTRVREIALKLRAVFQRAEFSTKAKRMGKVIRVTDTGISYYTSHNQVVQTLP